MKFSTLTILLLIVFIAVVSALEAPKPPKKPYTNVEKLSVGVKKRPETCNKKAAAGDKISVHYAGYLASDLSPFDSSYSRGEPFSFVLGRNSVIAGWEAGMLGACVGERRRLLIPYNLAYGERGMPPKIPAKSALIFDVEVVDIERKDEL
mmetsp:Transcript_3292/g.12542  ORF Transcript_3292/g.12542 Transcript_3292/m.12542 type:complete len:150 (+) Transcript_3292:76-525(+)